MSRGCGNRWQASSHRDCVVPRMGGRHGDPVGSECRDEGRTGLHPANSRTILGNVTSAAANSARANATSVSVIRRLQSVIGNAHAPANPRQTPPPKPRQRQSRPLPHAPLPGLRPEWPDRSSSAGFLFRRLTRHRTDLRHQRRVVESAGSRRRPRGQPTDDCAKQTPPSRSLRSSNEINLFIADIAPETAPRVKSLIVEQPKQRFIGVAGFDLHADAGVALAEPRDLRQHVHRCVHRQDQAAGLQRLQSPEATPALRLR